MYLLCTSIGILWWIKLLFIHDKHGKFQYLFLVAVILQLVSLEEWPKLQIKDSNIPKLLHTIAKNIPGYEYTICKNIERSALQTAM
jgi:hypothetical protein